MSDRTALDQALLEHLAHIAGESTRQTALMAELRGLSLNNVIWSGTQTLDTDGRATINTVTYAAFGVWALGDAVTVANADNGADAATAGVGVFPVPAGGALVWPMVGTTFTLYGTAGDEVVVALFSTPQPPMVANGGGTGVTDVDGGTP